MKLSLIALPTLALARALPEGDTSKIDFTIRDVAYTHSLTLMRPYVARFNTAIIKFDVQSTYSSYGKPVTCIATESESSISATFFLGTRTYVCKAEDPKFDFSFAYTHPGGLRINQTLGDIPSR